MTYKLEQTISKRHLRESLITREYLIREVAANFINELPVDKLELLFNIKVFDPTDDNINDAFKNQDMELIDKLSRLKYRDVVLFNGNVYIP